MIAPPGPIHRRAKPRLPRARLSRRCGASVTPASRSQPRSRCHRPPLAASCVTWDQTGYAISSRPSQNAAMNAKTPGEIIHIDIKKLGRFERVGHRITGDPSGPNKSRGAGWDFVHVCIDDHSRVAFSEINRTRRRTALFPFSRLLWLLQKSRRQRHSRHD